MNKSTERKKILNDFTTLCKRKTSRPDYDDLIRIGYSKFSVIKYFGGINNLTIEATKSSPDLFGIKKQNSRSRIKSNREITKSKKRQEPKKYATTDELQDEIIDCYMSLHRSGERLITRAKMYSVGVTQNMIRKAFTDGIVGLDQTCRDKYPSEFDNINVRSLLTDDQKNNILSDVRKYRTFLLSTAVTEGKAHTQFIENIRFFCKKNNSKFQLLISHLPASSRGLDGYGRIDKTFSEESIITEPTYYNSNFHVSPVAVSAKTVNPLAGLDRIGQTEGSFVCAAPKQLLKSIPVTNEGVPRFKMTTGACTLPNYDTYGFMHQRGAYVASNDHMLGAIIVDVINDTHYQFRQIQARADGAFPDLGKLYHKGEVTSYAPEALVLGDWHSGHTDPAVVAAIYYLCKKLTPNKLIIHDGFNGLSVCHHEENRCIKKAQRADSGQTSLERELRNYAEDLDFLSNLCNLVVVVKSNHDEFLDRYLESGRWVKDHENFAISAKLADSLRIGDDPVKTGVEMCGLQNKHKIQWLRRDEDYIVGGSQCGAHGDRGINGSRGTLAGLEQAYGNCVIGHSHSPGIIRRSMQVGTSTTLNLDYRVGPSTWLQSCVLIYDNGSKQMINIIDGNIEF